MRGKSTNFVLASTALLLACSLSACKSGDKQTEAGANPPNAKVNPTALQARAMQPPPPNATQRAWIGSGPASVQTANFAGDTDSFWIEQFDIDGNGTLEQTQLLWDDEDKVLYAYAQAYVPCEWGGAAMVDVLACVNAQGNRRDRPAGSGFYALYVDASECGAGSAGLYGCRFDASGRVTAWAAAVVDSVGDEIEYVGED